jgi:hypothetical protein
MPRLLSLALSLAFVGCAEHVAPVTPAGSEQAMSQVRVTTPKPADKVTAFVEFKNTTPEVAELSVYWSYAASPIWLLEARRCVGSGNTFDTKVPYSHIKEGPQIRFVATPFLQHCDRIPPFWRTVSFYKMNFDPFADFYADFQYIHHGKFKLCAHGAGNHQACDPK